MDEFSDFPPAQSIDPAYCQAWEACAERYQHDHIVGRQLWEWEDIFEAPKEGESRGYADDATWIMTSSFVIFTMQSGFGLLEAGSCSPGFEVNIMMKNIVDVVFTGLSYYLVGYGISFGRPSTPFMGRGDMPADGGYDEVRSGILYSKYIFQLSFAATSTTIVSGCVAMRLKYFIYMFYALFATIFYSFVAHWTYDEIGWLYQMGAHDFAGGSAVHVFGGMNGLVATLFLGPRKGRFDGKRPISDFFPSSPTSQCFGLLSLWWGWIGFNCGSSFGITDQRWVVAIRCAVTTINSTVGGGIAALLYSLWRTKGRLVIPDHLINGILGSLVAITPACASTHTFDAFPIGIVGAMVGLGINTVVCHFHIDDPVGAIGVHLGAGTWGLLSVGLFADSQLPGIDVMDGLFRGGGFKLLGLQVLMIVSTIGWSLMWSTSFFYFVGISISRDWKDPRKGLRVDATEEERGADWYLHGVLDQKAVEDFGDGDDSSANSGEGPCPLCKTQMYKRPPKIDFDSSDGDNDRFDVNGRSTIHTRKSSVTLRSVFVGHFDELESTEEQDERTIDELDNGDCGDAHGLETGSNSSEPAQAPPNNNGARQSRGGEVPNRRIRFDRKNTGSSRTGVLGHSAISRHSQLDPRALQMTQMQKMHLRKNSGQRDLQIYR